MPGRRRIHLALCLALTLASNSVAQNSTNTTITLYDVARPGTTAAVASQLFTAIGVGADGATTYRNEVYVSGSVVRETTTFTSSGVVVTSTGPDRTSTVFATLVAGATHFVYSHIPPEPTNPLEPDAFPPQVLNCTLHGTGGSRNGVCEIMWWDQGGRATETFTSTFSGHAIPMYTITAALAVSTSAPVAPTTPPPVPTSTKSIPEPVETSSVPQQNGAVGLELGVSRVFGAGGVGVGVLFGAVLAVL